MRHSRMRRCEQLKNYVEDRKHIKSMEVVLFPVSIWQDILNSAP